MNHETQEISVGRYLIKRGTSDSLTEIFITEISETSLKIRFSEEDIRWMEKSVFFAMYKIVEKIKSKAGY